MVAGLALRSALIQLMNPKPRRGAKCLRSRVLRLGETFGDVTNVLYVQGKIVEDCLDWELFAS